MGVGSGKSERQDECRMVAGFMQVGVVWQGFRLVLGRVEAIIYRSRILLIPSHTWIILSSIVDCKSKVSFKLSDGTSGVWGRSSLGRSLLGRLEEARAGTSGWVTSGIVEVGASCANSSGVGSSFSIGRVVVPCSRAVADGQLLMIRVIFRVCGQRSRQHRVVRVGNGEY